MHFFREELACRLPEMEQPGSDQENLDSEASLSSESLLDEQQRSSAHSSEHEGRFSFAWILFFSSSHLWFLTKSLVRWLGPLLSLWCRFGPVMVMGREVCSLTKQVGKH